jgi:transcriptional regulator with XRE-family HTH domain
MPPTAHPVTPKTIRLDPAARQSMGARLKAARQLAGYTMRQIAEQRGVTPSAVLEWEHGSLPSDGHRAALAELYGVSEQLLFAELADRLAELDRIVNP